MGKLSPNRVREIPKEKEMKNKPYGIYASTDQEGLWKRTISYKTMSSAMQALASIAAQKNRKHKFTILPNISDNRFLLLKGKEAEQILKTAR